MKEILRRVIEILKSKECGNINLEEIENRMSELRRRIIEIRTDKRGELGIPKDKVEAIAEMILPDIIAFFQTDEGKKVFEEWKKEQQEKQKRKGGEMKRPCNPNHYGLDARSFFAPKSIIFQCFFAVSALGFV